MPSLKTTLERLRFRDDAKVQAQLVDQFVAVKTRLAGIDRKLLVLSGKGGVGKSAVASQLALSLARGGRSVGVLDADLNGPSIPRMLGLSGARVALAPDCAQPPQTAQGIKVAALSFIADPRGPARWKGPLDISPVWLGMMESAVIRELLGDTAWGERDWLLVDLPPGAAADKPPIFANFMPDAAAVVVTTASQVCLEVVRRQILYCRDLGIELLGLVENMSGLFPGDLSVFSKETGLEVMARVPLDMDLAASLDAGEALPAEHPVSRIFDALAVRLEASCR